MSSIRLTLPKTKLFVLLFVLLFASWLAAYPASEPQKHYDRTVAPMGPVRVPARSLDDVFVSTSTPVPIPDLGQAVAIIDIEQSIIIEDIDVGVSLTHTWVRDLRITLERDTTIIDTLIEDIDSTFNEQDSVWVRDTTFRYVQIDTFVRVILLDLFPGADIENMTDCWFDQDAGQSIYDGAPPFTGAFRPIDSVSTLNRFDGQDAIGRWRLRVRDQFLRDSGTLDDFRIEINGVVQLQGMVSNAIVGTPVVGASVTVVNSELADTLGRTTTNNVGVYRFTRVPEGIYRVIFAANNYDSLTVDGVAVSEGETTTQNAELMPQVSFNDFPYTGASVPIPDFGLGRAEAEIVVDAAQTIRDVDVTVNITHTYIADLTISLAAPSGDTVTLFNPPLSPSLGANMANCRYDDEAAISINAGTGPFNGSYRPYSPLSRFDTQLAAGSWNLHVEDFGPDDLGTLHSYTLHFEFPLAADDSRGNGVPEQFKLHPAYPNPFNPTANLMLDVTRTQDIALQVFDISGRLVETLHSGTLNAGSHHFYWQPITQASGVYFVRAYSTELSQTHKLILLK